VCGGEVEEGEEVVVSKNINLVNLYVVERMDVGL
jgi:hypothetical protein